VNVVETTEPAPKQRSRIGLIAVTVGVVIAALLIAYGLSQSDDDNEPTSSTPPTIGVIQAPAEVATTQGVARPPESAPATNDLPLVVPGTADIGLPPPITPDIPSP
jgi:hypothetical protein